MSECRKNQHHCDKYVLPNITQPVTAWHCALPTLHHHQESRERQMDPAFLPNGRRLGRSFVEIVPTDVRKPRCHKSSQRSSALFVQDSSATSVNIYKLQQGLHLWIRSSRCDTRFDRCLFVRRTLTPKISAQCHHLHSTQDNPPPRDSILWRLNLAILTVASGDVLGCAGIFGYVI